MTKPLYKDELDRLSCAAPGCDHSAHAGDQMYLYSKCHDRPGIATYSDGKILVECPVCRAPVSEIVVAERNQDDPAT